MRHGKEDPEQTEQLQPLTTHDYEKISPEERWNQNRPKQIDNLLELQLLPIQHGEKEHIGRLDRAEPYDHYKVEQN